jgi:hypothetical protein
MNRMDTNIQFGTLLSARKILRAVLDAKDKVKWEMRRKNGKTILWMVSE